eukprot:TRINITY_DN847_c0_g2_i1.p1 TRINITY_DN847_c0_g2~~TRINITY_DN847_c0_g2_i1.p1  ORF type:complete len:384 (-),score=37.07 TRINITY_DN847_c0_g2_i1:188-1339(-)
MIGRLARLCLLILLAQYVCGWEYTKILSDKDYICSVGRDDELSLIPRGCCENRLTKWLCSECYKNCPLRDDVIEIFEQLTDMHIFGQDIALNKIKATLDRYSRGFHPIVMHFAGDNGVGKTFTARFLAQSKFQGSLTKGFLEIEGEFYIGHSDAEIKRYHAELLEMISQQLYRCPESLILLEEVEKIHPKTLAALIPFFSKPSVTYNNKHVYTGRATFIFSSDFGAEGLTEGKSAAELDAFVRSEVDKYWDISKKLQRLINLNVIPFQSLDPVAIETIIKERLTQIPTTYRSLQYVQKICFDARILMWLSDQFGQYKVYNARGVDIVVNAFVIEPLIQYLQTIKSQHKKNEELQLYIHFDESVLTFEISAEDTTVTFAPEKPL